MISTIVNYKEQKWLDQELDPDEKVIWIDKPIPKYNVKALFWFGILWTAISSIPIIYIELPHIRTPYFWEALSVFAFAVSFLLIGIGMLSTPLLNRYKMSNTLYVITEKRIIIFEKLLSLEISCFDNIDKNNVLIKPKEEAGDIIFYHRYSDDGEGGITTTEIGFFNIINVTEVYNYIVEKHNHRMNLTPTRFRLGI